METFAKLFERFLVFVYHCFDRIVIQGYLPLLSRPEHIVYFFPRRARSISDHPASPGEANSRISGMGRRLRPQPQNPHAESREGCEQGGLRPASSAADGAAESLDGRLCDRWSSGGLAEETAEWMAVTRARSASQPGAGADSSTPNPGKPFGTRSPLYRCWPHRLSTSGGNALPRP